MIVNKKNLTQCNLSIIIPVRNEQDCIAITIKVLSALVDIQYEVIIVYDKKEDSTISPVRKLQKKYRNIRIVNSINNPGVTNSIKKAWKSAKGKYILIMAADDIGPIIAINSMYKQIIKGYDVVSGTRYARGGRRIGGPFTQRLLSIVGNRVLQLITQSPISDATTGLKMFKYDLINKIDLQSTMGWAFAIEFVVKARDQKLRITEVPFISIDDRPYGGKSTFKVTPWFNAYYKWFILGIKKHFLNNILKALDQIIIKA